MTFDAWWSSLPDRITANRLELAKMAYAAGQAAAIDNGPTCHKCGKLVEEGDILCSEHEQQMVQALISAAKSKEG